MSGRTGFSPVRQLDQQPSVGFQLATSLIFINYGENVICMWWIGCERQRPSLHDSSCRRRTRNLIRWFLKRMMKAVWSGSFACELILICKWTESSSSQPSFCPFKKKWIEIQWKSNSRFVAMLFFFCSFFEEKKKHSRNKQISETEKWRNKPTPLEFIRFFLCWWKKKWIKLSHFLTSFKTCESSFLKKKKMISMITHFLANDWMGGSRDLVGGKFEVLDRRGSRV